MSRDGPQKAAEPWEWEGATWGLESLGLPSAMTIADFYFVYYSCVDYSIDYPVCGLSSLWINLLGLLTLQITYFVYFLLCRLCFLG